MIFSAASASSFDCPPLAAGRQPATHRHDLRPQASSDPHHLRHMQPAALGRKASDEFAIPLSPLPTTAPRIAHAMPGGRPPASIRLKAARKLWKETRVSEVAHPAQS